MNPRKGTLRQTIAGTIILGCGIALGWVFVMIAVYGRVYVKVYLTEPTWWILAAEIIMCGFFILFGLMRAYNGIMRERHGRRG